MAGQWAACVATSEWAGAGLVVSQATSELLSQNSEWLGPAGQSMNETTQPDRRIVNTETVGIHNVYFIQWIDSFLD